MPRRIAFINEKGGSSKTTLVANLGAQLALVRGRRVLAIDFDPQAQLGRVLGVAPRASERSAIDLLLDEVLGGNTKESASSALPIVRTPVAGLDLVVAKKSLGLASFANVEEGTQRLRDTLAKAPELASYDYVLFDAPPSFGPLTLSVLRAVDELVVPVPLTWLALDGCAELLRTVDSVRRRLGNPGLALTLVVPTFYRRTRMANELLALLKARFPKEISHTVVGMHVQVDEAQSRGLPLCTYAPNGAAARAFAAIAEELELRAPGAHEAEAPR